MTNSKKVTEYITKLPEWQRAHLDLFRRLIHQADDEIMEDIKWGVPVFLVNGKTLLAMSSFKKHTKYNFFNGYILKNRGLFNNGLDSKISRSIDLHEGEAIDASELMAVIKESINEAKA